MKERSDIIEFIKKFSPNEFKYRSFSSEAWTFEFHSFDSFKTKEIIDDCNDLSEFFSITGGHYGDIEKIDFNIIEKHPIKELKINFNVKKIKEFIYRSNKITPEEYSIEIILTEDQFKAVDENNFKDYKKIIFICPLKNISVQNELVQFTNTSKVNLKSQIDISVKTNFIRKSSTILCNQYKLPEYFYFEESYYVQLPPKFKEQFLIATFLSFTSNSRFDQNQYLVGIKGYKSISLSLDLVSYAGHTNFLDVHGLFSLYSWIYDEEKVSDIRLSILRNILSLDSKTENDVIEKIINPTSLLDSCKHQFELIINESIKDHFEYLDKIVSKVRDTVDHIEQQIQKLSNSIYSIVIGALGLIVTNIDNLRDPNKGLHAFYAFILLFFLIYQRWYHFKDLETRKKEILVQFNSYKDTIQNKLKVIEPKLVKEQLDNPICLTSKRFDSNHKVSKIIFNIAIVSLLIYLLIEIF